LTYGEIVDPEKGAALDEVLVALMMAPRTYTCEDILEIQCHGGYLVLQKVLELVLRQGARMAQPGEFTKRAFLNGRIDLTQAEAVVDVIRAKTTASLDIANRQLKGTLHDELVAIREGLVNCLALVEAHIDFPEEEIDPISHEAMRKDLDGLIHKVDGMLETFEEGRIFREGVSCAIVGKTNVGKSSLLNTLLREDRAIVTPIPGTTRDVIEEVLNFREIPVRLLDTAGLRKTVDPIEMEGVRRTRERVAGADFVILVVDGSRPLEDEDRTIFTEAIGKKKVVVVNKRDLPPKISPEELGEHFPEGPVVSISALRNEGIDDLKDAVYGSLIHRNVRTSPEYLIVANVRHKNALSQARNNIKNAQEGLGEGISLEFIAFEIRSALDALGEIVGETTTEEVLNRIFEQFCIGK
jgi:tRNA modification GTPase